MAALAFLTEVRDCEAYLAQAIESILNQTYSDFVYYIVDDGSTDSTREIIAQYAAGDTRIVPIDCENDMMGNFNAALRRIYASDAQYFALLDSDDWYELDFAETMIEALEQTGADLAEAKFVPHEEDGGNPEQLEGFGNVLLPLSAFAQQFAYYSFFDSMQQWWCKVYRVALMREIGLLAGVGWDTAFVLLYRAACKNFAVVDASLHHYRIRRDSDCHKRISSFDGGRVAAALTEQHDARLALLAAAGCEAPESLLMAAYQDVNGVKSNMMRIYAGSVPDEVAAREFPTLLELPFLASSYERVEASFRERGTLFFADAPHSAKAMEGIRSYYGFFLRLAWQHAPQGRQALLFAWVCRVFPHLADFFEEADLPLLMSDAAVLLLEQRYRAAGVSLYHVRPQEPQALLRAFCAAQVRTDRRFLREFLQAWQGRLTGKQQEYFGRCRLGGV